MRRAKKWVVAATLSAAGVLAVNSARAGFVAFPSNGHSYEVVTDTSSSWTQADAAARAAGGHLITITSAAEDQFVNGLLTSRQAPSGSYWMGLRRTGGPGDGTFQQWTTGEALSFTNWAAGVPDNSLGLENSGAILWTRESEGATFPRRGQWNDLADSGYPNPAVAISPTQVDLLRGGFVIERDGQGSSVPLPAAVLLFVPGAAVATVAARPTPGFQAIT